MSYYVWEDVLQERISLKLMARWAWLRVRSRLPSLSRQVCMRHRSDAPRGCPVAVNESVWDARMCAHGWEDVVKPSPSLCFRLCDVRNEFTTDGCRFLSVQSSDTCIHVTNLSDQVIHLLFIISSKTNKYVKTKSWRQSSALLWRIGYVRDDVAIEIKRQHLLLFSRWERQNKTLQLCVQDMLLLFDEASERHTKTLHVNDRANNLVMNQTSERCTEMSQLSNQGSHLCLTDRCEIKLFPKMYLLNNWLIDGQKRMSTHAFLT